MNVTLLWLSIDDIAAPSLISDWTTRDDFDHVSRRRAGAARNTALLARAALRILLMDATGSTDWRIAADPRGKPAAVSGTGAEGPAISLSHSHGLAAAALAATGEALGIDVEHRKPRDFIALAQRAFGPQEILATARGGSDAFYRIWTGREAMSKATGDGLTLAADGRDHIGNFEAPDGWQLAHLRPTPDYSLSVAMRGTSPMTVRRHLLEGEAGGDPPALATEKGSAISR